MVDGTGDNARDFAPDEKKDANISNPLKMNFLAGGDIDNQFKSTVDGQECLYVRGVGGVTDNKLLKNIRFALGDLDQQTEAMWKLLEGTYEEGDKLYLVGFSRGSASARRFACELDERGVKTTGGKLVEKPPIEFLGCFDTVSMQIKNNFIKNIGRMVTNGISKSSVLGEKDGKLPSIVKRAVHNMSLDDNRSKMFPPCYMDSADDRVVEVWFPGEHGDSGGTYYSKGLPDGSFRFMQEWMENLDEPLKFIKNTEIADQSLVIKDYPDVKLDKTKFDVDPDPTDKWHLKDDQIDKPQPRKVAFVTNEKIVKGKTVKIHESVLDHMEATPDYFVNRNLKKTDFVVVGSLGKTLEDKTARLKELIGA